MDISSILRDSADNFTDPPSNESNTCQRVILPVLYGIGYGKKEVDSQDADSAGKRPDYTLLPGIPDKTFYLEAKAWGIDLEDSHVNQALNYANQNGKRWVVLTNGRVWRLYDNWIRNAPASGKKVAEAILQDAETATRFLSAISRKSVMDDGIAAYAEEEQQRRRDSDRRERLRQVMSAELVDENSGLVAAIRQYLAACEGFAWVSASDVVAHFKQPLPPTGESTHEEKVGGTNEMEGDVLVIPARYAWGFYKRHGVYPCQPNRSFRPTTHLAFYCMGKIEVSVPKIIDVVEAVELTEHGVQSCAGIGEPTRGRLKDLVQRLRHSPDEDIIGRKLKVMFLSSPESPETISLQRPVINDKLDKNGKPWAFTVGQRYVSMAKLRRAPKTTSELEG